MSLIHAIVLGLIQGATEFVPISSSGHLVLVPWVLGWERPGLVFDTVVHWGTLLAVLVFFWKDWWRLIKAWFAGVLRWDWHDSEARLMWLLVLGSIPAAVIGYFLEGFFEALFKAPAWVSAFLLVTAALLVLSERTGRQARRMGEMKWLDALMVGLAQAAAIAPGISRSGATIGMGLLRGVRREDAARFSFLLSTPIILGAGLFKVCELLRSPDGMSQVAVLVAGFVAAALSGYVCIWGLLRYLQKGRLYVFAAYCAAVGVTCLAWTLL